MKARFAMSMTSNTASRVPLGPPVPSRGFAGGEAWCAEGNYREVGYGPPSSGTAGT